MATKPTQSYDWATDLVYNGPNSGPNRIDPPTGYQEQGYAFTEKPPYEYINGWQYIVKLWLDWCVEEIDGFTDTSNDFQDQIDEINDVTIPNIDGTESETFTIGQTSTNTNTKYFRAANDADETDSYVALKYDTGVWSWVAKNDSSGSEYSLDPTTYGYQTETEVETIADERIALDSGVQVAIVRDEKSSGTGGGTISAATWTTRDLNTLALDTSGSMCTVDGGSNTFSLTAGKYLIEASVPAQGTNGTRSRLVEDPSGSATVIDYSDSAYFSVSYAIAGTTLIKAYIDISSTTDYSIEMRGQSTGGGHGMGRAASDGSTEIYTVIKITRLRA